MMVANVAVLGSLRVHPNRHFGARRGTSRPCIRSLDLYNITMGDADTTLQPQHTQEVTQNEKSELFWTHFWGDSNHAGPMGADEVRAGHVSSSFLRIGAIHGVPDASRRAESFGATALQLCSPLAHLS